MGYNLSFKMLKISNLQVFIECLVCLSDVKASKRRKNSTFTLKTCLLKGIYRAIVVYSIVR